MKRPVVCQLRLYHIEIIPHMCVCCNNTDKMPWIAIINSYNYN